MFSQVALGVRSGYKTLMFYISSYFGESVDITAAARATGSLGRAALTDSPVALYDLIKLKELMGVIVSLL
jgi:hypothetical protein